MKRFACVAVLMLSAASALAADKNDYADAKNWLCRPDKPAADNACAADLSTTVVAADGSMTREAFEPAANPPIDCFYVYPTISNDPTPNSDMTAGPEEKNVTRVQFARFGRECRLFAPVYRQVTLTALRANLRRDANTPQPDRRLAYSDVVDAWNYYLQHDNNGRGVVLVGHSQGSGVLTELIKNEIDGKPVQSRLVSALLLGTSLSVPAGKDVGGAFQHVPVCRSASQVGCAIAFASFRSTIPPPANSLFGRAQGEGMSAACVNPAAPGGGRADLHTYIESSGRILSSAEIGPWVNPPKPVTTPFVSVPGLISAQCVANEHGSYLEVTVNGNPSDPRTDDIVGDVIGADGKPNAMWGLHLVDVQLTIGNLLDVVRAQGKAYVQGKRSQ